MLKTFEKFSNLLRLLESFEQFSFFVSRYSVRIPTLRIFEFLNGILKIFALFRNFPENSAHSRNPLEQKIVFAGNRAGFHLQEKK